MGRIWPYLRVALLGAAALLGIVGLWFAHVTSRLGDALERMERRLDPSGFARISRSAIVNVDRIDVMHDWSHGDRLVVANGTELELSRRYRDRIEP